MDQRSGLWWGTVEGVGLRELVEVAARGGFSDISVTPAMYVEAIESGSTDEQLRSLLDDHGVAVAVIDPLIKGLPGSIAADAVGRRFRSTFEYGEDVCTRAAIALGARAINVAHFLGSPTPTDVLADAVASIAQRCAPHGIDVLVEFMPEGGIGDLSTAADIVALADQSNCGLTFDTWHYWRGGGGLDELRALPAGMLRALQLSDALDDVRSSGSRPPTNDRLLPGQGKIPLSDIVTIARENFPEVIIGLEVFSRDLSKLPADERAALAMASLQELLAQT